MAALGLGGLDLRPLACPPQPFGRPVDPGNCPRPGDPACLPLQRSVARAPYALSLYSCRCLSQVRASVLALLSLSLSLISLSLSIAVSHLSLPLVSPSFLACPLSLLLSQELPKQQAAMGLRFKKHEAGGAAGGYLEQSVDLKTGAAKGPLLELKRRGAWDTGLVVGPRAATSEQARLPRGDRPCGRRLREPLLVGWRLRAADHGMYDRPRRRRVGAFGRPLATATLKVLLGGNKPRCAQHARLAFFLLAQHTSKSTHAKARTQKHGRAAAPASFALLVCFLTFSFLFHSLFLVERVEAPPRVRPVPHGGLPPHGRGPSADLDRRQRAELRQEGAVRRGPGERGAAVSRRGGGPDPPLPRRRVALQPKPPPEPTWPRQNHHQGGADADAAAHRAGRSGRGCGGRWRRWGWAPGIG